MNILVVNWTWYPSGGDWTYVEHISDLYSNHGHQVIPFSMKDERNYSSPYSNYFINNIDYKKLNKRSLNAGIKVISKSIYSKEAQNKLEKLLDTVNIDFAHINVIHHYITPAILKTLKQHNIPIIWTLHEYTPICPESTFISHGKICEKCFGGAFYHCITQRCKKGSILASTVAALENYAHSALNYYSYVDYYICPSKFLFNKFKQFNFFQDKLIQLYHGYDYLKIDQANAKKQSGIEKYIVFTGRLEKIKGAHTVLEAMRLNSNINLKIIGSGSQEPALKAYQQHHELYNITFLGKLNKEQTLEIISNAQFAICASEWYEVLGFTVVEAMALNKPVIGSNIGAIPEMVIDGETGLLFEPGDANQLAEKIMQLINQPQLIADMGSKAQNHIQKLINDENHYNGLKKLLPRL